MLLRIYTLSYCDICLYLKDELRAINLDFEETYCDQDATVAKLIQYKLATENYPIVLVETNGNSIYFISGTASSLRQIGNNEYFTHYESIKHLIHLIQKTI